MLTKSAEPAPYSGLILPATITCFHFSYWERVKAAPSSGLVRRGSIPILANAAFKSGCCSTLLISPLSLARTGGAIRRRSRDHVGADHAARTRTVLWHFSSGFI